MRYSSSLFCLASLFLSGGLTSAASAQIINGDFSAGNTGFSSDYMAVTANGMVYTVPPDYGIISNPSIAFTNGYASFGDHTTGSGLMLFGDGSGNSNDRVWYQTVTVTPNTTYTFSAFAATDSAVSPSTLNFYKDADMLGSLPITAAPGVFQQLSTTLTTGSVSSIVLAIRDGNTAPFGNDFVIDDISLTRVTPAATPEPGSIALLIGLGVSGSVFVRRRKQARQSA